MTQIAINLTTPSSAPRAGTTWTHNSACLLYFHSDLLCTLASVALLAALLVLALVAVHHQQATTDVAETQHASTALASYAPSRNRANRRAFKRNEPHCSWSLPLFSRANDRSCKYSADRCTVRIVRSGNSRPVPKACKGTAVYLEPVHWADDKCWCNV